MNNFIKLEDRSLILVSGKDSRKFLQSLISNDINLIDQFPVIYSVMLNPQGRFLYDFFVSKANFKKDDSDPKEKIIIDCQKDRREEIIKKFSLYKLRAEVEIKKNDDLEIFAIFQNQPNWQTIISSANMISSFCDPRSQRMGIRVIGAKNDIAAINNLKEQDMNFYNRIRIDLKIPDHNDLIYDKSLVIEYGFDDLGAINYQKGCYIGQEVTARSHYLGEVRKKIYLVEIQNIAEIEKETEIFFENKKVGIILSSVTNSQIKSIRALALIKKMNFKDITLTAEGQALTIIN